MITWEDFEKIDIRVGTIISAIENTKAKKPAYIIEVDFGNLGVKKSSAQLTVLYSIQELIGKQVIAIINFPPKQIAQTISEFLILGTIGENNQITLLSVDKQVTNGLKVG